MGMHISTGQLARFATRQTATGAPTFDDIREATVNDCCIFRENIIFVGSELSYDSFWLKMMFIACGFALADRGLHFRKADRTTIAYVDKGYTKAEKLPLEMLKTKKGINLITLSNSNAVVKYINNRPNYTSSDGKTGKLRIQDIAFFSHGLPQNICLNYKGTPDVNVTPESVDKMTPEVFVPEGRIYSYACRTGIDSWYEPALINLYTPFSSDADAHPETSLAQKMATHFNVNVYAFYTRSFYGNVLRKKSDSDKISNALKTARETQDGEIIEIPPEHEGIPHPDLDNGFLAGSKDEGTNEYALWRKQGAIAMPVSDTTPAGLTKGLQLFKPK